MTTLPLTLTLAIVFGAYMVAAGFCGLLDAGRWQSIVDEFKSHPGLCYVTGAFVYALGAVLVIAHNNWGDPLAVIVTIVGWAALIEGFVLLAAPKLLFNIADAFVRPAMIRIFAAGSIALGFVLVLLGLTGQAG